MLGNHLLEPRFDWWFHNLDKNWMVIFSSCRVVLGIMNFHQLQPPKKNNHHSCLTTKCFSYVFTGWWYIFSGRNPGYSLKKSEAPPNQCGSSPSWNWGSPIPIKGFGTSPLFPLFFDFRPNFCPELGSESLGWSLVFSLISRMQTARGWLIWEAIQTWWMWLTGSLWVTLWFS